ncbi:hypothetical protein [Arthrobacter sp. CAN_C5]|uniref:hypothetical protein n=1 Tax=Arthrobacter sp. CAN_C5 TaxID=2760706 RepID=UPI001AE115B2|nr:hypothetical protein [Arthrobacter sp. CAN_C5]MBP2216803.1 hypothetical protein [Arthrobacter sp. CAN_C5]
MSKYRMRITVDIEVPELSLRQAALSRPVFDNDGDAGPDAQLSLSNDAEAALGLIFIDPITDLVQSKLADSVVTLRAFGAVELDNSKDE